MKMIRMFLRWGSLYLLVALFLAGLFWEETLPISSFGHGLLICGLFLAFGFVMNRWIFHHETNFLISASSKMDKDYRQIDLTLNDDYCPKKDE